MVSAAIIIVYVLVAWQGSNANDRVAQAFARAFCVGEHALFPRQFAACGAGEQQPNGMRAPLVKESTAVYKFYASGRRYCQGCLATLSLRNRADAMQWIVGLFLATEDVVDVEVYMQDAVMPPMVLALGTPRQAQSLAARSDVSAYAKPLKTGPGTATDSAVPNWPAARVQVMAEASTLFTELFSHRDLAHPFTSSSTATCLRYFRSLVITSESSAGSAKRLLRFSFALPPADDMKALAPLLALIPAAIDLVANYKMSPEAKKRALDARARTAAATEAAEEERRKRIEAAQKRKIDKMVEEKERIARLAPEARRKAEEKLAKQAAKKGMKVKMVRM